MSSGTNAYAGRSPMDQGTGALPPNGMPPQGMPPQGMPPNRMPPGMTPNSMHSQWTRPPGMPSATEWWNQHRPMSPPGMPNPGMRPDTRPGNMHPQQRWWEQYGASPQVVKQNFMTNGFPTDFVSNMQQSNPEWWAQHGDKITRLMDRFKLGMPGRSGNPGIPGAPVTPPRTVENPYDSSQVKTDMGLSGQFAMDPFNRGGY